MLNYINGRFFRVRHSVNVVYLLAILLSISFLSTSLVAAEFFLTAAEFYVAPTGKSDNAGTKDAPFDSVQTAIQKVRQLRKQGEITAKKPVNVHIAAGNYYLPEGITLEKEDSGSENQLVRFIGDENGKTLLIGGISIPSEAFVRITDQETLKRLAPNVRSKVLVADLTALSIPQFAEWGNSFSGSPTSPPELFFDDEPMTIARWPNTGWAGFKTPLDSGMPHNEQTAEQTKKATDKANVTFTHPDVDVTKLHGGSFVYNEEGLKLPADRISNWNVENGVWLCGYWTHDWSENTMKVASIDPKNRVLTFQGTHGYGVCGGNTWSDFAERRYFAMNLLEELDAPGEWYLDRKNHKLYFLPPTPIARGTVVLSTLTSPIVQIKDAEYILLENLSFGPTFGPGVTIRGGKQNKILGCLIKNTGGHGISLEGGFEHEVRSCNLYNIGSVGVNIHGGDRKTLQSAGHLASNNHIHHFGRLQRTYAGAFSINGVGQIVRNNLIHDAPHLAISYGGNENLIERNEIYNVVQETSDAGTFYTGRDWTTQGNVIRENYVHHVGSSDTHGTMGVYLDDCDSGDTIERNIFYQASRAVFIGGGRDNIVRGNLFLECFQGIHLDSRGMSWKQWNTSGDGWNLEEKAEAVNYKNPPWSEKYPKLATLLQNEPKAPLGCVFEDNIFIDCIQWLDFDGNVLKLLERTDLADNVILKQNLIIENTVKSKEDRLAAKEKEGQLFAQNVDLDVRDFGKWNFQFSEKSPISKILPKGFQPIPFDKIGLFVDEYRKKK
ncbi:MAG: right-handed parallel beta-helix repeat-containing protein [Thermoguttaceae bacterium]